MKIRYLHTMVRVKDLEASMAFYRLLGLEETRRIDKESGRFTLVFMAPPEQPECAVELTYNWDGDEGLPSDSRHFGHLAYEVERGFRVGSLGDIDAKGCAIGDTGRSDVFEDASHDRDIENPWDVLDRVNSRGEQ